MSPVIPAVGDSCCQNSSGVMDESNDLLSGFESKGLDNYPGESIQRSECPGTTE